jgi:hypothetical protein
MGDGWILAALQSGMALRGLCPLPQSAWRRLQVERVFPRGRRQRRRGDLRRRPDTTEAPKVLDAYAQRRIAQIQRGGGEGAGGPQSLPER